MKEWPNMFMAKHVHAHLCQLMMCYIVFYREIMNGIVVSSDDGEYLGKSVVRNFIFIRLAFTFIDFALGVNMSFITSLQNISNQKTG